MIVMKRYSRMSSKRRIKRKLPVVGYWKIPKTGLPSKEILAQLELKPLDYDIYARKKEGEL